MAHGSKTHPGMRHTKKPDMRSNDTAARERSWQRAKVIATLADAAARIAELVLHH